MLYLNPNIKPLSIQQNHVDQLVTLAYLKRNKDGVLNQQFHVSNYVRIEIVVLAFG